MLAGGLIIGLALVDAGLLVWNLRLARERRQQRAAFSLLVTSQRPFTVSDVELAADVARRVRSA